MSYVYRYIDLDKEEVVYIGKVNGDELDCLTRRHEQHKRDSWYTGSTIMQFKRLQTPADADIAETYLISMYAHTGQLANRAKTGWGQSALFIQNLHRDWIDYARFYERAHDGLKQQVVDIVDMFFKDIQGGDFFHEGALDALCDRIRELQRERLLAAKLSRYDKDDDFLRTTDFKGGQDDDHNTCKI